MKGSKALSIVLSLALVLAFLPIGVFSASAATVASFSLVGSVSVLPQEKTDGTTYNVYVTIDPVQEIAKPVTRTQNNGYDDTNGLELKPATGTKTYDVKRTATNVELWDGDTKVAVSTDGTTGRDFELATDSTKKGSFNAALNAKTYKIEVDSDNTVTEYYKSDTSTVSEALIWVKDSKGKPFELKNIPDTGLSVELKNKDGAAISGKYVTVTPQGAKTYKLALPDEIPVVGQKVTFTLPIQPKENESGTGSLYLVVDPVSAQDQFAYTEVELAKFSTAKATVSVVSTGLTFGDNGVDVSSSDAIKIRISEPVPGTLKSSDTIKISLPDGFKWNGFTLNKILGPNLTGPVSDYVKLDNNNKDLVVSSLPESSSATNRYVLELTLGISVDSQVARKGDVVASVGGADPSTITVGKYGDYEVKVTGEPNDIWAGRKVETGQLAGKLVLEELLKGSLVKDRTIKVTLPDGAEWDAYKKDAEGKTIVDLNDANDSFNLPLSNKATLKFAGFEKIGDDVRVAKFTVDTASSDAGKTVIEIKKVLTKPSFNGALTVEVSGNAGVSGTATIANVKPIITVSIENKRDVVIGARNQAIGDIVVKENVAGALKGGKDLVLTSEVLGNINSFVFADAGKIEVRSGDIEFQPGHPDTRSSDTVWYANVKHASTTPSEFVIKDVKITLSRVTPEGDLKVKLLGEAVFDYKDLSIYPAQVITPADQTKKVSAKFTIDSMTYVVNGETKAMDVAPFIQDNRTFVPVRYVAEALGVKDSDIIWNPYAKSVTIFKGDRVIQMKIGSKTLLVNGSAIEMDTAPVIKDARTVLPIAWVAKALNVDYVWNDAERSVEFNYTAQ